MPKGYIQLGVISIEMILDTMTKTYLTQGDGINRE